MMKTSYNLFCKMGVFQHSRAGYYVGPGKKYWGLNTAKVPTFSESRKFQKTMPFKSVLKRRTVCESASIEIFKNLLADKELSDILGVPAS